MRVCDQFSKGLCLYASGDLSGAAKAFKQVLSFSQDNADALDMLGVVMGLAGDLDRAEALILRAIAIDSEKAGYHKDLGNVYKRMKRYDAAKDSLCQALFRKPDFVEGNYDLGVLYQTINQPEKALSCYKRCLELDSHFPKAYNNAGLIYLNQQETVQAKRFFELAIENDRHFAGAHLNLGVLYKRTGNHQQALSCFHSAASLAPNMHEAYCSMGEIFQSMGRIPNAIKCHERVTQILPCYAAGWVNLGTAYHDCHSLDKAMHYYQKALSIDPQLPQALLNKGIVHREQGRYSEALSCFRKAFEIDGDYENALVQLVGLLIHQCEWKSLHVYNALLDKATRNAFAAKRKPDETPFLNIIRQQDPLLNFHVAKAWSETIKTDAAGWGRQFDFGQHRKVKRLIRLGYLSANFQNHPTSELILGLMERHNRQRYEVFSYSYGKNDGSVKRKEIVSASDCFKDLSGLTDSEAADLIYNDQVDVLIDLMGYTKGARMRICAGRPAPVQVRYLGMAGTTGADFFDYIIVDDTVCLKEHESYYSEKPVYMPYSYQVNNYASRSMDRALQAKISRANQPFIFCSFSTAYKIDASVFNAWMRILTQSPDSVLWLMPENSNVGKNLLEAVQLMGVNPERIIFKEKLPIDQHLNRLQEADIALDTMTVNGAATTSDALWAGLPVLTLKGSHFASRMSESLLCAVGLSEMVAGDLEHYEKTAVLLANTPAKLHQIRQKLQKHRTDSPLFDTGTFVKSLEKAFELMWERFVNNKKPAPIVVVP